MKVEIIAIGDELTSGRILNTTSGYAARKLFDAGYTIHAMSTIGDTPPLIGEALLRAIGRVDFIIVTGGLGSTDDDLTNEAVSQALDRPTMPNLEILARIRDHLKDNIEAAESPLEKLAWLPSGADPFYPTSRIAGYQLIHNETPIFFLPGVPDEMKDLMKNVVLPKLSAWEAGSRLVTRRRIYKVFGMTESEVNRKISQLTLGDQINIGYYPVFPDVHVSILSRDSDPDSAETQFNETCQLVERTIGSVIYGTDHDELESIVGTMLVNQGLTISFAESCTGGLLSHRITRVPGSSTYFTSGIISYANDMKVRLLGIDQEQIEQHGAVSHEVAAAMAEGALTRSGADVAIGITGIAGPDGGSELKPVGTVHFGLADSKSTQTELCKFPGDRHRIQTQAAHYGLNMLRLYLLRRALG
jgi:nicotinamide-nucleotide amidase